MPKEERMLRIIKGFVRYIMLFFSKMSDRSIRSYCRLIKKATGLGVPLSDIISETRSFHGETFTEEVMRRLPNM